MKKILLALIVVTFASSLCFAQQPTASVSQTASKSVVTKTFKGKVDSVSIGDPTKKIPSKIVVVDDKGQKLSFTVRTTTTDITDKGGKATTLGKMAKDDKVAIEYITTQKGTNKAKSIKVL